MGIIVLALTVGGFHKGSGIPVWGKISTALIISAGAYAGGWRIMRTLGRKVIHLDPPPGFAAETAGASILCTSLDWAAVLRSRPRTRSPQRSWV
jgi:PiT family inorganic phosphate transporter